ncbi:MAG: tRNA (N(6)-L-threonylcarbamoyladenosine(37)-C(2))-methylthiotransferase MtaB [Lachnospiraceae bacterium]|nr:tRNA (N(6)-L-threonylcarbamoyladenosine(37)-C(2))-methylthiotransferase MtaB [Lachnospiraceae bacterium]
MTGKTFAAYTLGCKVNQYETDAMEQLLKKAGYQQVDFKEKADIYLINTCSVTNMADRKSRQMIHRARKRNPDAIIAAAGCYVQAQADQQAQIDENIDLIIGNNKKKEIVTILEEFETKHRKKAVIDLSHTTDYEELSIDTVSEHTRAYLKIQDGCNQFCSYCIIPYVRGRIRSRKPEQVIEEVKKLAKNGYREVVLTGIHLSSYGKDLSDVTLIDLIEELEKIDGLDRIRLGSLEPRIITEDFVKRLSAVTKICPHFHLSLQSGCDETLKRMNRHYTIAEYEHSLALLRKAFFLPALTTDVIVGFPGETEEEFCETKKALERMNLYEMHIFKYSIRQGTKAEKMLHQVPENIKTERSNVLLALSKKNQQSYEEAWIGKEEEILLEEEMILDDKVYLTGHTKRYVKVGVLGVSGLEGSLVKVKIIENIPGKMLIGEIKD